MLENKRTILYIGGFVLPDKNAAAQRVIANAKAMRALGYDVQFLSALKNGDAEEAGWKTYYGFPCCVYPYEGNFDYLITAKTVLHFIREQKPSAVIAYNYPGAALTRILQYCHTHNIRCFADATEWYQTSRNIIFRIIKNTDTYIRMQKAHFRMDGVIAISDYLYQYYKDKVPNTVKIPPLVDMQEEKWTNADAPGNGCVTFIYCGSPSGLKERLDVIVQGIDALSGNRNVLLNIVGITKEQFTQIYPNVSALPDCVHFLGRVSHTEAIQKVQEASWSIIIRDNNLVVKAGFPTKLVESISCGTPVIVNRFSNVCEYLDGTNSIVIDDTEKIGEALEKACEISLHPDKKQFDYHSFLGEFQKLLENETGIQ